MKILAIDTSGTTASAALVDTHTTLAVCSVTQPGLRLSPGHKTHSETLLPMVENVLQLTGHTAQDVDAFACTCGPGSFTGLRIGAATAKGLAFATGKPLVPVPTLDALAYAVASVAEHGALVAPLLDARRGEVYAACYKVVHDATAWVAPEGSCLCFQNRSGFVALPLTDFLAYAFSQRAPRIIFTGDGAALHQESIQQTADAAGVAIAFAPNFLARPFAPAVGELAAHMYAEATPSQREAFCESRFALMYVRKPQAEREREERLANR